MTDPTNVAHPNQAMPRSGEALIGQPVNRIDGVAKVTGRAVYSADTAIFGDVVYGFIVGASVARGRILRLDVRDALSVKGVREVLSHLNAPPQAPPHPRATVGDRFNRAEPFLFSPDVRWHGEPVALVLADTWEVARDAASLIRINYDATDASLAFGRGEVLQPEKVGLGQEAEFATGDLGRGLAEAEETIAAEYRVPYQHNMPLEPHATIARWDGDRLTVWSTQQGLVRAQGSLAKTFGIPPEAVTVITQHLGGGFGAKAAVHAQAVLAALGARALGQPVKVVQTRQQMFPNTSHRPAAAQTVRLGASRDGRLVAMEHFAQVQTTRHDDYVEPLAVISRGLYACPNRLHHHRAVVLDLPAADIMRAPGEAPGSFAIESAMDELAERLGLDPIELRRRNEPAADPETGKPFSSRLLIQCFDEGAARFGWKDRSRPGTRHYGAWEVGMGVAAATYPALMRPCQAELRLESDGTAVASLSATDLGTGTRTVIAQFVAEELGLPLSKVRVEIGDSRLPPAAPSGGSFGAASFVNAVHAACQALSAQIANRLQAKASEIWWRSGQIVHNGSPTSVEEFLRRHAPDGLRAASGHQGTPRDSAYASHAYGAQFVEVGVHRASREIRIRRMLGVFAAGRILNEKMARSQLLGGMIWGASAGLMEESLLDERFGAYINHDLAEYHVPVHADVTDIDVTIFPERDEHANPLGVKGLGEIGIVGVAAAVANAIYNATGIRIRETPITLDKLLRAQSKPRSP